MQPSGRRPPEASAQVPGTQVMRRAHEVLRYLALHGRDGARVTDLAQALSLHVPTAHRIVQGLMAERMVEQDPDSRHYFLGPALFELGLSVSARFPWLDMVQPSVFRVAELTGDTVVVTLRSGLEGVCLERRSGAFPIQTSSVTPGTRRPLAAGAGGLAILSQLAPGERQQISQHNALALGQNVTDIGRQVAAACKFGYAQNTLHATRPTVSSIAVPVLGAMGTCQLGLSVVALAMRLTGGRRAEVLAMLRQEAQAISQRLADYTGVNKARLP